MLVNNIYIKDLRIFTGWSLKDIVLVDNAAYSFAYQICNGIPIISWHDDRLDTELKSLVEFMKYLATVEDVRDCLRDSFHMDTYYDDYAHEFV
jgi:CTD small phosphatase-like protein 2